ncbi:hypothetical protein H6P81_010500 [Aristolochia fimbriata]|uniref:Uncharacterized protein n=1 Tax=Aristolochia fimbriata TaxID=158543 RepID=A0AAV7ER16_ARIFI|nr:hypothetical protein H6P81_010500 [Aristolochia fimbriata]
MAIKLGDQVYNIRVRLKNVKKGEKRERRRKLKITVTIQSSATKTTEKDTAGEDKDEATPVRQGRPEEQQRAEFAVNDQRVQGMLMQRGVKKVLGRDSNKFESGMRILRSKFLGISTNLGKGSKKLPDSNKKAGQEGLRREGNTVPGTKSNSISDPDPEANPNGKPGTKLKADPNLNLNPDPEANPNGKPGTKLKADPNLNLNPDPDVDAEADPDAEVEAGPDAEAEAEAGPDADAEAGPDADAEAGPDTDAEAGPDADAEAGPDADAEVGPDADAEAGPDAVAEAGPDTDVEVDPDADTEVDLDADEEVGMRMRRWTRARMRRWTREPHADMMTNREADLNGNPAVDLNAKTDADYGSNSNDSFGASSGADVDMDSVASKVQEKPGEDLEGAEGAGARQKREDNPHEKLCRGRIKTPARLEQGRKEHSQDGRKKRKTTE